MKKKISIIISIIIVTSIFVISCSDNKPSPRPKAYFRIDLPEKSYKTYDGECPFTFDIPVYSFIVKEKDGFCWMNIYFPQNKATIYLTYQPVNNNLDTLIEYSRALVYKHTIKADAINETNYENDSLNVYGILYDLKGNTATSAQFFLTDGTKHFLRGSFYFELVPNRDSLNPVIDFIREDIVTLMESLEWK